MASILRQLQEGAAERLLAMPEFASVAVLPESVADLDFKVAEALAKMGIAVVVYAARAAGALDGPHQPYFQRIGLNLTVFENVPVNRREGNPGYTTGQEYAELCACYLHGWKPDTVNESFVSSDVALAQLPKEISELGVVGWSAPVTTQGGLSQTIPQVAPVVLDASTPTATATCATPGAAIFYTLDGTFPSPRNPSSILYLTPFTPDLGTVIKAAAWLAGYNYSGVSTATAGESGAWTYIGQGVRYSDAVFQLKCVNEALFHTVACGSPQGFATLLVGDGVGESGGWPLVEYFYFGQNVRADTNSLQLYCAETGLWHPLLAVPLFGSTTLALDSGIAGSQAPATGETHQWGTTARVTDAGLELLNADESAWYRLVPSVVGGNPVIALETI